LPASLAGGAGARPDHPINSHRFHAADGDGQSLKQIAENALRETERVCSLVQRIGGAFEAPLQPDTGVKHGREVIRWWSRAGTNGGTGEQPAPSILEPLTPRECEVLRLVIEGCSNKEGGSRMQISYRTFETHRASVMRKFGAKNAADLIRLSRLTPDGSSDDRSDTTVQA
jgi:DNA-binding CsgD family transcriptional regulator